MSTTFDASTVLAIHELYYDYAAGNDDRDLEAIGRCFSAEGSFGLQIAGQEPWGPYLGREAVLAFMGDDLGAQRDQRRHVMTNIRVSRVSDDEARSTCYFTLLVTDGGTTRVATTGVYRDRVVLDEGRWVFAEKWLDLEGTF